MSLECTAHMVVFAMSLMVHSQYATICHVVRGCNVGKMEGLEECM